MESQNWVCVCVCVGESMYRQFIKQILPQLYYQLK